MKTTSESLQGALDFLDGRIAKMREVRNELAAMIEREEGRAPGVPGARPTTEPARPVRARGGPKSAKPAVQSNQGRGRERIKIVQFLAEPFDSDKIASAFGIEKEVASVWCCNNVRKGILDRVSIGVYRRGKLFGARIPASTSQTLAEIHAKIPAKPETGD